MPLAVVLIVVGFQVPVIPFGDVVSKAGAVSVLHKVKAVGKSGTMAGVMVTASVTIVPH